MSYFKVCPECNASLDPGECCDCGGQKSARLCPYFKQRLDYKGDSRIECYGECVTVDTSHVYRDRAERDLHYHTRCRGKYESCGYYKFISELGKFHDADGKRFVGGIDLANGPDYTRYGDGRFEPNPNYTSPEPDAPWMCNCGYEGDRAVDGGECPQCHGLGACSWNG